MDKLTKEERDVIDELRRRTINKATSKMLEDDSVFYRFAKGWDFDLVAAENMFKKHISWRKEWVIDSNLTDYTPPEVLDKYASSTFLCLDKEGDVVRLQDYGRIDIKGVCSCVTKTEYAKHFVYLAEQDKALLIKRGKTLEKPFFHLLDDLEDISYAKAANGKTLQYLIYCSKTLLDNYPESFKRITFINAPIYFPWLYAALKPILPASITNKMRVYGSDGWKEALLKDIDADNLPVYLGGNKTDPDGNPLCETIVQRGKPIPKNYYRQNKENRLVLEPDAEKITVRPFSSEEMNLEVKENNLFLEWEFEVKKGDIDFSLKFKDDSPEIFESVDVISKRRIETFFESEKGFLKCERMGTYLIIFDNSYSWLHSKEIYYRIRMTKEFYESA